MFLSSKLVFLLTFGTKIVIARIEPAKIMQPDKDRRRPKNGLEMES